MKKPVRWNAEEREKICDHLVSQNISYWDADFLHYVRIAQERVFRPERHKIIKGRDNLPGMGDDMTAAEERHKALVAEREAAAERARREEEIARAEEADARKEAAEEAARAESQLAIQRSHPLDKAMETLASELVNRFFYHLRLAFDEESRRMFEDMGEAVPAFKHIAAARRRKIMIVGLKPREAGEIVNEFGSSFDFKMVEFGASVQDLKHKIGHQEAIVCMTDFIGHSHNSHIKHHPGYIPVAGNIDRLRHTLRALAKANSV